jgi:uncharacterized protein (TIGR02466 family)
MRIPILSQHIYAYDYPGDLEPIVEEIEKWPLAPNTNNLKSSFSFLFENPEFSEVGNWCRERLREACADLHYSFDIRITQSWFNKADYGMWHHRHAHSNSFMSGIFYLTPSNSHTWFSMNSMWPKSHEGDENHLPFYSWMPQPFQEIIHKHPTTPGQLVIFPSWLDHSVDNHLLEKPRYSIAFNSFPVGPFGLQDFYSFLDFR